MAIHDVSPKPILRRAMAASFAVLASGSAVLWAQEFPSKPIRIVTSSPGGGSDFASRIIAQGISGPLGQQVIVDNRSGVVGQELVAKAAPDGYVLLVDGTSLWTAPLLQTTQYDMARDFAPVSLISRVTNVLVVHPSLPVNDVKGLITLAKARPGELNYAAGNAGSAAQLSGELFKAMAGVKIVMVPYKGTGPALTALMGGETQLMFTTSGSIASYVKSGRLRALAVTSAQPTPLVPGVPTVAATVPGYESSSATGLLAPGKTPAQVISRLHQEVARFLNRPDVKEKFFNNASEIVASSPEEFAALIRSDVVTMGKVIKDAGIKLE